MNLGADFLAAFQLAVDGYRVAKGFLAQAKLVEPSENFSSAEFKRLKDQCENMLEHSQASYVFLYSQQSGIVVIPAIEIVGARECNPHELTNRTITGFYKEHFECFIGDIKIQCANNQTLEELRKLRQMYKSRNLVYISGTSQYEQLEMFN